MIEQVMMWLPMIAGGIFTAITGFFFRKETVRIKRAEAKRAEAESNKLEAESNDAEWQIWKDQLNFANEQLKSRNEKVDALYRELREEQKVNQELRSDLYTIKGQKDRLEISKCLMRGCSNRKPPSDEMM